MPSDRPSDGFGDAGLPAAAIDVGLLSPVTIGHDDAVTDAAVADALVTVEVALARAWAEAGVAPVKAAEAISAAFGWRGPGSACRDHGIDVTELALAGVAGGNPVIPLVGMLGARVDAQTRPWIHRGATSQDILDSALALVARAASARVSTSLAATEEALARFAAEHRDLVAAARTLGQHAVPTTIGLRAATWLRGVRRARARLDAAAAALPAQLGGAAGTLASFVQIAADNAVDETGAEVAERLPALLAAQLGLAAPEAPWHTTRWPVTELGDALVQSVDALGVIAADVVTLSRTEIAELSECEGGGSSAMPQKQNPAASVLIRSAALRAPQLGATLHLAAALAVDERPDGAWHAEWPTLRELLRLALGAAGTAVRLTAGLRVDAAAVRHGLGLTNGLIVAERLSAVLGPRLGKARVAELVAAARDGGDLATILAAMPDLSGIDVRELLDPARYTGLAGVLVDRTFDMGGTRPGRSEPPHPDSEEDQ